MHDGLTSHNACTQLTEMSSHGSKHVGAAFWGLFSEASAGSRDSCSMLIGRQEAFRLQVLRGEGSQLQLVQFELRCVCAMDTKEAHCPAGRLDGTSCLRRCQTWTSWG